MFLLKLSYGDFWSIINSLVIAVNSFDRVIGSQLSTFCEGRVRVCCHLPIILAKYCSMKYGSHKNRRRLRRYSVGNSWTGCTFCTIFANLPHWVEIFSEGAPVFLNTYVFKKHSFISSNIITICVLWMFHWYIVKM